MTGDSGDRLVRFSIDPTLGGETFSITPANDALGRLHVRGSNANMLLTGTYFFLDRLGCRFLAPQFRHYQGAAEVVPKSRAFDFKPDLRGTFRRPKFKYRKLYVEEGHSHDIDSLKALVEWMPKVGYNTLVVPTDYGGSGRVRWDHWRKELTPELQKRGITIEVGGHGYQNFLNAQMDGGKLFQRQPQWFGQDEKGARSKAKNRVFCTSNMQAVDYVANNVIAYLKERPEIRIFDFWPPDGARWCTCDECKLLGEPPDRQAILLRQVQAKLKPVRPDVRLEVIAYSSYLNPPSAQAIDKDVLIDFCPISQHFDAPIFDPQDKNKLYADALLAWRQKFAGDISIYSYYRKYAWDSLPVIIPHYMQRDLQWYAKVPVQGVSVYCEPGDWFTYELNHYVLAHLAWDPDADVDALVRKFCDARYGSEAAVAQAAFDALERNVRNFGSVPHVPLKPATQIEAAAAELAGIVESIAAAHQRAGEERVKEALRRLELICTYAQRDLEIQHLRATAAPREQILPRIESLHAFIVAHSDEGVFLLRGGRLSVKRMLTRYDLQPSH